MDFFSINLNNLILNKDDDSKSDYVYFICKINLNTNEALIKSVDKIENKLDSDKVLFLKEETAEKLNNLSNSMYQNKISTLADNECIDLEWLNWDILEHFHYKTRDYVMIKNIKNERTYICYKSNSGMLWHLLIFNLDNYYKFYDCGLYSTSLLLDLNLQKKICQLSDFDTITSLKEWDEKIDKTTLESLPDSREGGLWARKEDSYIETIRSHGKSCERGPYTIFKKITSELEAYTDYPSPDCGHTFKGSLNHSSVIYHQLRKNINLKMNENFIDLGKEKELYSCCSGKVGIEYFSYKFVKNKVYCFQREIQDKTSDKNKFQLVYAKYKFIEDKTNNIELPKDQFRDKEFITPLFITSCNNIQKDYPLINKVAAAGLYTCKVFEYKEQTIGSYNYRFDESKLLPEEKLEGAGQYFFIGEFMDKLWPFEGWQNDLPEEHYRPEKLVDHSFIIS